MKKGQGGRSALLNKYYLKILNPLSNKAMHFETVKIKGENAGYEHFDFSPLSVIFTGFSDTNPFIQSLCRGFCMTAHYCLLLPLVQC